MCCLRLCQVVSRVETVLSERRSRLQSPFDDGVVQSVGNVLRLYDTRVDVIEHFRQLSFDGLDDGVDHVDRVLEAPIVLRVAEDDLHELQVLRLLDRSFLIMCQL